jgi:hypothetical protein
MTVEATERWRKPPQLVSHDWDEYSVFTDQYGQTYARPHMVWEFETVERFRLGYLCINCFEPFERPFPEVCTNPYCADQTGTTRFSPARDQQAWFDREFRGGVKVGPEHSLEEIQELDLGTKSTPNKMWLPPGARRS